ncbi:hypothetical protein ACFOOP_03795 [Marinicaulis aureus]|uniref:STAS/SEC14 domain-containing protein n=1 Tax=Hyphococcus aureus TaxID=2666033 RepID=A0ABW1KT95_9PROT
MPYETTWSDRGVHWRYYGDVTAAETRLADAEFYGDARADRSIFQLIDLRDVTRLDFPEHDQELTAAIDGAASISTPLVRVAFIVPDDRFDEALKIYLELINRTSWSARIFTDPQTAEDWCERRGENPISESRRRFVAGGSGA